MPKTQAGTESYSYARAQEKINILKLRGYQFVGSLPEELSPWGMLKLAFFLFVKGSSYYQYRGKSLLSDSSPKIEFDANNEPLAGSTFSKILDEDYIYIIGTPKKVRDNDTENFIVLLKKNAAITGHSFLIGPYMTLASRIIGGELYHHHGKLLLINRKSGSFHSEVDEAMPLIRAAWGAAGEKAFHSAVEKDEVLHELQKRKALFTAAQKPPHLAVITVEPEPQASPLRAVFDVMDTLPGIVPIQSKPVAGFPLVSAAPSSPLTNAQRVTFFSPEAPADEKSTSTYCRCVIL